MDEKLLQGSAKKIIALVECANTIERLSQTKEINGPEELRNDHNTYLALSKLAHKAYETGSKCKVFVHTFRGELRTRRNQFSHLEEDLTKPAVLGRPGIDTITEEEFWASDLSPQGYLQKILHAIYNALKNPAIATEVDRQRKENGRPPITTALAQTDFEHAKIINQMAATLENGIVCLVGLLKILEENLPSKAELFKATAKLVTMTQEQFDYAVSQLEAQKIIRHSVKGTYLLITNEKFCNNTAVDFIEKYGASVLIQKLGGAA